jgi:hypothetical protein
MAVAARAAPPPNADPALHAWFEAQHSVEGRWCCNISDGHILDDDDWQIVGDGYQVKIAGEWWGIPAAAMRDPHGGSNPTGHAIAWYNWGPHGPAIYCFAPGFEL